MGCFALIDKNKGFSPYRVLSAQANRPCTFFPESELDFVVDTSNNYIEIKSEWFFH